MTKNQQIISKLNQLWCRCCAGHHKNCDTYHILEEKYCFGDITYNAFHNAYVGEDIDQTFNTKLAAENYLIQELKKQIKEQCDFGILREEDEDRDISVEEYKNILKDLNKLKIEENPSKNFEEKYLELLKTYNGLKYSCDLIDKILEEHNIPEHGEDIPELDYSVNYRVELLIEELNKKNHD